MHAVLSHDIRKRSVLCIRFGAHQHLRKQRSDFGRPHKRRTHSIGSSVDDYLLKVKRYRNAVRDWPTSNGYVDATDVVLVCNANDTQRVLVCLSLVKDKTMISSSHLLNFLFGNGSWAQQSKIEKTACGCNAHTERLATLTSKD